MMELCFFPDDFGVDDFGVLKGGVSSEEDLEGIFSSETSSSSVYSSKSAYKSLFIIYRRNRFYLPFHVFSLHVFFLAQIASLFCFL